jgi:hypothetical protein
MGIANAETGAGETILVVQGRAIEFQRALRIHKNLGAVVLDNGIGGPRGIDFHDILEARATAFFNSEAESFP